MNNDIIYERKMKNIDINFQYLIISEVRNSEFWH